MRPIFLVCLFLPVFCRVDSTKHHIEDFDRFDRESNFFSEGSYLQADERNFDFNNAGSAVILPVNHPGSQQKCVDIPQNMSLCHGIGYSRMLLPNLMQHETLREANEQSQTWMPLANIKCHQHTRLFLCSLFAPICPMQQPQSNTAEDLMQSDQAFFAAGPVIYPCRSLCEAVKQGCQGVMSKHGFPWPDMLSCSKFPVDNDMCISPNPSEERPSTTTTTTTTTMSTTFRRTTTSRPVYLRTRRPPSVHLTPISFRTMKTTTTTTTTIAEPSTTTSTTTTSTTTTTPSTMTAMTSTSTPPTATSQLVALDVGETCPVCDFVKPIDQLDEAVCQSAFVAKVRFRRKTRRSVFLAKRPKFLKVPSARLNHTLDEQMRNARSVDFFFEPNQVSYDCRYFCGQKIELKNQLYLVLGVFAPSHSRKSTLPQLAIRTILPWFSGLNSKDFRLAEKSLQQLKCPNHRTSATALSVNHPHTKPRITSRVHD
ncbi:hypothetical protein RvY_01593 [Ramazzottius varieornatus]|uniref:FZ domain-containing protein n=1 Tax=Ramazzottius varieornatus TaxID=947166 RepID=A0A1D1UHQ2_RAMVA|nr:hypothetical protein RvY_01593 [Ramazzottius varieornatus]